MPDIETARSWYLANDPVHGFDHVLRVYRLAERIAHAEGADLEIVRAAVLLHDSSQPSAVSTQHSAVSSQLPDFSNQQLSSHNEQSKGQQANKTSDQPSTFNLQPATYIPQPSNHSRETHHHSSAEFAREVLEGEGWVEERIEAVLHCIRAHRFRDDRESPQTLEARVVFDADKLDAIGAIGAARAVAYAATHGQPAYAEPSEQFCRTGEKEQGEPHSAYHEFLFKLSRLKDRLYTRSARRIAEERHRFLEEFYERLIAEINGDR